MSPNSCISDIYTFWNILLIGPMSIHYSLHIYVQYNTHMLYMYWLPKEQNV